MKRLSRAFAPLLIVTLLGTWMGTEPIHAQEGLREFRIEPEASRLFVVTHRVGLFSFLGHDHAILAPVWTATLCWNGSDPAASFVNVVVDAAQLVIDSERAREMAGLHSGPSPGQREQIQRKLLDDRHLAAQRHPELRFETSSLSPAGSGTFLLRGSLTIRDVTRQVELPVAIATTEPDLLRASGALTIRQSDFGIRPESVAGVVRVADPVDIHFLLQAVATGMNCSARPAR